jgi:cytochrome P450 family 628
MDTISPDFYTHLSQSEAFNLNGGHDANLAIIAGADTNAITVSNALYLLCRYPEYKERLYHELKMVPDSDGIIEDDDLIGKPYLLGIISESLRLHPPVPSGVQRVTPSSGAVIAGRYIPGDTVVTTPTYSLQRGMMTYIKMNLMLSFVDPRAFSMPDEFIPERWTSKPELILRKDAFVAFGYGQYNCAGKPLAMMQIRMVLAMIIKRYDISFPPDRMDECRRFIEDQADCFTIHLNPLPLMLGRR